MVQFVNKSNHIQEDDHSLMEGSKFQGTNSHLKRRKM